jgi:hypothetical protein
MAFAGLIRSSQSDKLSTPTLLLSVIDQSKQGHLLSDNTRNHYHFHVLLFNLESEAICGGEAHA